MVLFPERRVAIAVVAFSGLAIFLMLRGQYVVAVPGIDSSAYPARLALLSVVALFVERAVEVILTPWRAKTSEVMELERDVDAAAGKPVGSASLSLLKYKLDTQRIAFWLSTGFGVALAATGFRALEWFIEPVPMSASGSQPTQRAVFAVLDVVVTGMVLGGGADGIHKMAALIGTFVDQTRKRVAIARDRMPHQV